ncbi:hypothetical protein ACRE_012840 [Hapsidospora chrysogenum ATCC 11550]|uniref:DUF3074 domain-containing protein n=1 Tax=Hapsidospora chrysogenum (strain ATCC 11550 / CBS 779.69 / DSM 880 / IAM 14645 / JCM 23072 / IMI 49137) TaxID=857340 RepID=A0A086TF01_HAPC1|nr:hypothetical protein ACRE_012840 [Hapsidospora chrysogenum ATCC 11550]
MGNHHEPLKSLGSLDWADVPQDDLKSFLHNIFADAHTVIDSVPSPTSSVAAAASPPSKGRSRAKTDSAVGDATASTVAAAATAAAATPDFPQNEAAVENSRQLQKEWKEVKVNPRENPLGVKVYKMSANDGGGAWFARRSVHEGLTFDQWKAGLDREFIETMEVQGGPGSGSIRGIGADKRVEDRDVPDAGHLQVFQLSAQFPGPTSPRDFITLLLTSDFSHVAPSDNSTSPRQYMIVSKPCTHPECPPRQGIIRGQYESVELIREVPLSSTEELGPKRSQSSVELAADKSAAASTMSSSSAPHRRDRPATAIEWLMVTRSDPGGTVPRFMIEKGTPPGIVNDAGKFLRWVTRKATDESQPPEGDNGSTATKESSGTATKNQQAPVPVELDKSQGQSGQQVRDKEDSGVEGNAWSNNGLYGMITGAFGAASSVLSGGLQWQPSAAHGDASDGSGSTSQVGEEAEVASSLSETSSIRTFASALEKARSNEIASGSVQGDHAEDKSHSSQPHLKELKRLEERRRKLEEKAAKTLERVEKQRHGNKEKDAAAIARVREKYEKEAAKQEAKYKRELRRIEEKRENEERKAAERKKKAAEREEKHNLSLELEKVRAERDVALKQVELLTTQVGELQAQNTRLAAQMGRPSRSGDVGLGGVSRTNSGMSTASKLEKTPRSMSSRVGSD